MNCALAPVAVATVEASKDGPTPSWSTKIVVVDGVPTQFLTTRTVEVFCLLVIVQVMVPPSVAGEVTANGPPV